MSPTKCSAGRSRVDNSLAAGSPRLRRESSHYALQTGPELVRVACLLRPYFVASYRGTNEEITHRPIVCVYPRHRCFDRADGRRGIGHSEAAGGFEFAGGHVWLPLLRQNRVVQGFHEQGRHVQLHERFGLSVQRNVYAGKNQKITCSARWPIRQLSQCSPRYVSPRPRRRALVNAKALRRPKPDDSVSRPLCAERTGACPSPCFLGRG